MRREDDWSARMRERERELMQMVELTRGKREKGRRWRPDEERAGRRDRKRRRWEGVGVVEGMDAEVGESPGRAENGGEYGSDGMQGSHSGALPYHQRGGRESPSSPARYRCDSPVDVQLVSPLWRLLDSSHTRTSERVLDEVSINGDHGECHSYLPTEAPEYFSAPNDFEVNNLQELGGGDEVGTDRMDGYEGIEIAGEPKQDIDLSIRSEMQLREILLSQKLRRRMLDCHQ